MIYTPLTKKAMRICLRAHQGQLDKSGMPYILHPFLVADHMEDEYTTCAALLHDVAEDTDITIEDMRSMGMPEPVLRALDLLDHRDGVPYLDYVRNLKSDPIARAVKLGDLAHNSDLGRLDQVTEKDRKRLEKYKKAREILLTE